MTEAKEEKSRPLTLVVQLVVIPLAVVLFCLALGGLFMWLTSERKGFDDYLRTLRSSSGTRRTQQAQYLLNYIQDSKRWQGIFDLTAQMSGNPENFLASNPRAVTEIAQVFEESGAQDPKTRRYLALVLGLLGDRQAIPALRQALSDADPDTVKNSLWALARIGDSDSSLQIIELTHHDDAAVRLMAVYALGLLDNPQARTVLAAALNDPDEMVKWNAAFALANKRDAGSRMMLLRLLDKEYVDRFPQATAQNRQRYRVSAVNALAKVDGAAAVPQLQRVANEDADLLVRNAAVQQLKELKEK